MRSRILLATLFVAGLCCAAYWRWQRPLPLRSTDFLLIGEIADQTGDDDFAGSFREVLRVLLLQSPFLNLGSDEKIRTTLGAMGKSEGTPLATKLSQAWCERVGAEAYLTGLLDRDGSAGAMEILVHRCPGDERIAKADGEAARADQLIHPLGLAAVKFRADLGERQDTLKKFDTPLERASSQ